MVEQERNFFFDTKGDAGTTWYGKLRKKYLASIIDTSKSAFLVKYSDNQTKKDWGEVRGLYGNENKCIISFGGNTRRKGTSWKT